MSKFKSKSGLPEQLGSDAYAERFGSRPPSGHKPPTMCDIPGCTTRRKTKERMPDGREEWTYQQGYGEVVIRTANGTVHGHVCQVHYMKILDDAGMDQLSVAARMQSPPAQADLQMHADAPIGLIDHLTHIQEQLQHAQDVERAQRWQRDLQDFQRASERDEALAAQWAAEHDDAP
jgi:hypothetical protein